MTDGDAAPDDAEDLPKLPLREPLPAVVDTPDALRAAIEAVHAGRGPVAVDAERASGYRYSARAYLVQLRREGSGTVLIDPIPFGDLSELDDIIGDTEWILHAASQDLPCLADVGLAPVHLFDTELAGRLLNLSRVGLASLVKELLGFSLAKEHSAVDWSRRPLPQPWLEYAALDVEVLIELRTELGRRLAEADKLGWAEQEFAALTRFAGPPTRLEPWRRVSGIHRARGRRSLAIVRALWEARDEVAAQVDTSPGRVLHDAAIMDAAVEVARSDRALRSLTSMRSRYARRHIERWREAVESALALPDDELPTVAPRYDGPPPARSWPDRDPAAAARLAACRETLRQIADEHDLPVENLLAPDAVRRLTWEPPDPVTADVVARALEQFDARPWQIDLTAAALTNALSEVPPTSAVG